MLYTLLCVLVFILIIQALGAELIWRIIGVVIGIVALIGGYFLITYFSDHPDEAILGLTIVGTWVGILIVLPIFILVRRDKKKEKAKEKTRTVFNNNNNKEDELYEAAVVAVREAGKASASYLQRKLGLGYTHASRLIDTLEERGVIGHGEGANPREVFGRDTR